MEGRRNRGGPVDLIRHLPEDAVSTTHLIAAAFVGVGSIQRLKAVRWGLATNIIWAWVMTIPASAFVGAVVMIVIRVLAGKD